MEALMHRKDAMDETLALLLPRAPRRVQPTESAAPAERLERPGVSPWAAFLPVKKHGRGQEVTCEGGQSARVIPEVASVGGVGGVEGQDGLPAVIVPAASKSIVQNGNSCMAIVFMPAGGTGQPDLVANLEVHLRNAVISLRGAPVTSPGRGQALHFPSVRVAREPHSPFSVPWGALKERCDPAARGSCNQLKEAVHYSIHQFESQGSRILAFSMPGGVLKEHCDPATRGSCNQPRGPRTTVSISPRGRRVAYCHFPGSEVHLRNALIPLRRALVTSPVGAHYSIHQSKWQESRIPPFSLRNAVIPLRGALVTSLEGLCTTVSISLSGRGAAYHHFPQSEAHLRNSMIRLRWTRVGRTLAKSGPLCARPRP
ncbi:hypothetical protein NDU88_003179 [Pleurodeles waltl]|uniref:Uncharacterized protein n=1 Tax=Pleurodeles waltl TaxID=8319 RepID=A0AAV7LGB3_PLEWA|nr:hypothetical protein NDU88_003179 [Pleurodeles waltl]